MPRCERHVARCVVAIAGSVRASEAGLAQGGGCLPCALTSKMLASSMPVSRVIFSTRVVMMKVELTITAKVNAICSAISTAPVLLRIIADRMGRTWKVTQTVRVATAGGTLEARRAGM